MHEKMDFGSTILAILACFQVTYGQTVTVTGPSAVEQGSNTEYTCTLTGGDPSSSTFVWRDESLDPIANIFFNENPIDNNPKHDNFAASVNGATSTMTITNTVIADEGVYRCTVGSLADEKSLAVEVRYTLSLNVTSPLENGTAYEATCDALNGRPNLTITWMLGDDESPCDNIDEQPLPAPADLFSKRSLCTFQADSANNEETLRCIISGHQVSDLNGENTTTLNITSAPRTGIMTVRFEPQDSNLRVSCVIADEDQPNPSITNYDIYRNDTFLIHQSDKGVNFVNVTRPNFATDFRCEAGNYLGSIISEATYDPSSPTTLPTPTEPITTEGPTTVPPTEGTTTSPSTTDGENTPGGTASPKRPSAAAIGGGVAGAIVVIIIVIVIIYFVKREKPGPSGASSTKKHGSSTVGTSNGSEKNDVAAPLNSVNEVVTEDKIKPVAAPRDQGSIQHTTDNPGQAEYAMVDRKKPGVGDMPDTRGPGQKEPPQGMLYADLDLSASAGHTEKKVPQNKDDVVVYSSILV